VSNKILDRTFKTYMVGPIICNAKTTPRKDPLCFEAAISAATALARAMVGEDPAL
jgi:hypothetical protein